VDLAAQVDDGEEEDEEENEEQEEFDCKCRPIFCLANKSLRIYSIH
jgi:hypothetical protein